MAKIIWEIFERIFDFVVRITAVIFIPLPVLFPILYILHFENKPTVENCLRKTDLTAEQCCYLHFEGDVETICPKMK